MKVQDMHSKTYKQLEEHALKLTHKLAELEQQLVTKDEKNIRQIRQIRRERAQTLTIATQQSEAEEEQKQEKED